MFEGLKWELGARMSGLFGGSASNSNITLSGMAGALEEMNLESKYIPSFRHLGSPEDEAREFATVVVRAEKAGVELNKQNIDRLVEVTRKDREIVEGAITKRLLIKFLYFEKHLSLTDLDTVYTVQEALYNDDQKNDLDDVAKTTGIPLDVVRDIDNMMEEFLAKWSVAPSQSITGDSGNQKKKQPKTKPITVGDPNASQGTPTP